MVERKRTEEEVREEHSNDEVKSDLGVDTEKAQEDGNEDEHGNIAYEMYFSRSLRWKNLQFH